MEGFRFSATWKDLLCLIITRQKRGKTDFREHYPTDFSSEDLAINYIHVNFIEVQGYKDKIKDTKVPDLLKSLLAGPTPSRPLKTIDQVMVSIHVSEKYRLFYLEPIEPSNMSITDELAPFFNEFMTYFHEGFRRLIDNIPSKLGTYYMTKRPSNCTNLSTNRR